MILASTNKWWQPILRRVQLCRILFATHPHGSVDWVASGGKSFPWHHDDDEHPNARSLWWSERQNHQRTHWWIILALISTAFFQQLKDRLTVYVVGHYNCVFYLWIMNAMAMEVTYILLYVIFYYTIIRRVNFLKASSNQHITSQAFCVAFFTVVFIVMFFCTEVYSFFPSHYYWCFFNSDNFRTILPYKIKYKILYIIFCWHFNL